MKYSEIANSNSTINETLEQSINQLLTMCRLINSNKCLMKKSVSQKSGAQADSVRAAY